MKPRWLVSPPMTPRRMKPERAGGRWHRCIVCGTEFFADPRAKFCRRLCRTKHRRAYYSAHYQANRERRLIQMQERRVKIRTLIAAGVLPGPSAQEIERRRAKDRDYRERNRAAIKVAVYWHVGIREARRMLAEGLPP
jgi:hypothetical protein